MILLIESFLSLAWLRHWSSRLLVLIKANHASELPRAVCLSLHNSQHFSSHRLWIGRILVREVAPLKCPVSCDPHVLDLCSVAKSLCSIGARFPTLVVSVDGSFANFRGPAGLNANRFAIPQLG